MEESIFLAKLLAIWFTIMGLGLAINVKNVSGIINEFNKSKGLRLFAGAITTLFGIAIVITHNVWEPDWRIFITIIGWISLSKGTLLTLAPDWTMKHSKRLLNKTVLGVAIMIDLIIGLYLAWFAFVA